MNVIIIHGSGGEGDKKKMKKKNFVTKDKEHWFPWVKEKLKKRGIVCEVPLMPESWDPKYKKWKKEFEKLKIDENSILIGTSAGAVFLVRWLGDTKKKIKKLILVAPVTGKEMCNKWVSEIGEFEINSEIKDNIREVIIFTSDNEYKERVESAKLYSKEFSAELIELEGRGHFIEKHMKTKEFPELLEKILE